MSEAPEPFELPFSSADLERWLEHPARACAHEPDPIEAAGAKKRRTTTAALPTIDESKRKG